MFEKISHAFQDYNCRAQQESKTVIPKPSEK